MRQRYQYLLYGLYGEFCGITARRHDMRGILRHINRETGKLENFFLPRFAR